VDKESGLMRSPVEAPTKETALRQSSQLDRNSTEGDSPTMGTNLRVSTIQPVELPARSPAKSPGISRRFMRVIETVRESGRSGMVVPFALASPRTWKSKLQSQSLQYGQPF